MAWTAPKTWSSDEVVIATGTGSLNEQIRDNLLVLSTHAHSGAAGNGASTLSAVTFTGIGTATFADQSGSPSTTGRLQRNGANLEWYNGSAAIVLTASDSTAGTAMLRSLGTSSTTAAAGNHTHTFSAVGTSTASGTYGDLEYVNVGAEDNEADANSVARSAANTTNAMLVFGIVHVVASPITAKLYAGGSVLQTRASLAPGSAPYDHGYLLSGFVIPGSTSSVTYKVTLTPTDASSANSQNAAGITVVEVTI